MFRYDDDEGYYDRPDPVLTRGCTCAWGPAEEPCRFCAGEFACEGGCGSLSYDCQCRPEWDELSNDEQWIRIRAAFEYLCTVGRVPYSTEVGDDGTWHEYAPAIELAAEWYNNEE